MSLYDAIHQTLRQWYTDQDEENSLTKLAVVRHAQSPEINQYQAVKVVIEEALKALDEEQPDHSDLLRKRFFEEVPVLNLTYQRNESEATVRRKQRAAIERLAKLVQDQENQLQSHFQGRLEGRLPLPTYDRLIGFEDHLQTLLDDLATTTPPWLLAIEGMGGMGKTSIADALMRRIIATQQFEEIGWVSAQDRILSLNEGIQSISQPALNQAALIEKLALQLMPDRQGTGPFLLEEAQAALQVRLKQTRHLIVIDNLETVQDVEILLPTLRNLTNPSKFLITTRHTLHHETGLHHFKLPSLRAESALELIRHTAKQYNLTDFEQTSDDELQPIYDAVGGHPMALRLVVGQAHVYSLDVILHNLTQAQGQEIEALYTYIYQQSWENLDEVGRQVLLAMPLMPNDGGDITFLASMVGMDQPDLINALNDLVKRNLVSSVGGLRDRRYTIHPLTRTFLQNQIVPWE
ncbi:MAG: NB-ARC domain-containing protein [Chloroflexota bacterium]